MPETAHASAVDVWWQYRALLNELNGPELLYYLSETSDSGTSASAPVEYAITASED